MPAAPLPGRLGCRPDAHHLDVRRSHRHRHRRRRARPLRRRALPADLRARDASRSPGWPGSSRSRPSRSASGSGPAVTGVLQSTLGNLPEFFIVLFALSAGEVVVAQTSIIGSIFANALLVLGLVIVAGCTRAAPTA